MSYYEIRYKIIESFHAWVERVGGKKQAVIILCCAFTAVCAIIACCFHLWQRSFSLDFQGRTFRLMLIDKRNEQHMVLRDEFGNGLVLTQNELHGRSFYWGTIQEYSILIQEASFLAPIRRFSVYVFPQGRIYRYSDSSSVERQVQARFIEGLTGLQAAEHAALYDAIRIYERYVAPHMLVIVVLGSSLLWLLYVMMRFYNAECKYISLSYMSKLKKKCFEGKLACVIRENRQRKTTKMLHIAVAAAVVLLIALRLFHLISTDNDYHAMEFPWNNFWLIGAEFDLTIQITLNGEKRVGHIDPMLTVKENLTLFKDFVIVHGEADAFGFPDCIVVAWPDPENPILIDRLARFNTKIRLWSERQYSAGTQEKRPDEIDLEAFGLDYPITIIDIVDNWESVLNLQRAIR